MHFEIGLLKMITNNCKLVGLFCKETAKMWPQIKIRHWTVELKKIAIKDFIECSITIGAVGLFEYVIKNVITYSCKAILI